MTFSPSTLLRALPVMFATAALVTAAASKEFTEERQRMVAEIEAMIAETAGETGVVRLDARVQAAMASVPRHEFVPREYRSFAYRNGPLPIGNDQTMSQPYLVALMTELLQLGRLDKRAQRHQPTVLLHDGAPSAQADVFLNLSDRTERILEGGSAIIVLHLDIAEGE